MTAVELKNVSFAYEGHPAEVLKNVNFSFDYGEVALLSGMSGEGKSTVMSLISGIIPGVTPGAVGGEVLIDGASVNGKKLSEICRTVGVVLQNAEAQIIQQFVEDEIAFGCENIAVPPTEIESRIEKVCKEMELCRTDATRTLSGGQKQRLITASTLAMGQKIVVLDEPLANLDQHSAGILMRALQKLAKAGFAILIIEHRLDMVLPYVDSVWNIAGGKIDKVTDRANYFKQQANILEDTAGALFASDILFRLKSVAYSVKKKNILTDVNFEIKRGERVLLLGENGSGKTTLTRLISRVIRPTGGDIEQYVDAKHKRRRVGKHWFKKIGVVYQNPNYQLFMPTVRQEVAFGSVSAEKTEEMLVKFGLAKFADRHPHSLSEGQKRKLTVAAVLASDPEVLILDEPTVGQDFNGLQTMVNVINEWRAEQNGTLITVTHDFRCASALADKVIVIKNGVAAEIGGKELVERYFDLKF